jgi:lauroyl/myristoyl acyltransferase
VVCLPRKDGGYIVRYLPELPVTAESTPAEIAQACWDALEPSLQVHPELWLWSYKHWRYRPKSSERYESEGYPFYAGEYEPFQELIEKMG